MDIAYPTRSHFLNACETAIRERRAQLEAGRAVEIALEEGGYEGRLIVSINHNNRTIFGTDWEGSDPASVVRP